MEIKEVKNAYVPNYVKDFDGVSWMQFSYSDADKDPWKWTKLLECNGKYYKWMSFNSDNNTINYKEIPKSQIAFKK